MGKGLWEVRVSLLSNWIVRMIFMPCGEELLMLHGFIKKTQQTPESDLDVAEKRARSFRRAEGEIR